MQIKRLSRKNADPVELSNGKPSSMGSDAQIHEHVANVHGTGCRATGRHHRHGVVPFSWMTQFRRSGADSDRARRARRASYGDGR